MTLGFSPSSSRDSVSASSAVSRRTPFQGAQIIAIKAISASTEQAPMTAIAPTAINGAINVAINGDTNKELATAGKTLSLEVVSRNPPATSGLLGLDSAIIEPSPGWWNGRHGGFKIRCSKGREGSTPSPGTGGWRVLNLPNGNQPPEATIDRCF